jgi:hypothetical protein
MKQSLKDSIEVTSERDVDRRRAKRLYLNFSVEISGVDRSGCAFVERTKTEDISDTGCRLFTTIPFKRGDLLDIKLVPPYGEKLPQENAWPFEIIWAKPTKSGWSVGARQIHGEKIWKVLFPAVKRSSETPAK